MCSLFFSLGHSESSNGGQECAWGIACKFRWGKGGTVGSVMEVVGWRKQWLVPLTLLSVLRSRVGVRLGCLFWNWSSGHRGQHSLEGLLQQLINLQTVTFAWLCRSLQNLFSPHFPWTHRSPLPREVFPLRVLCDSKEMSQKWIEGMVSAEKVCFSLCTSPPCLLQTFWKNCHNWHLKIRF